MSMATWPFSVPGCAICIALLLTVASTSPSTTRTSQSEISTPLSLIFGPTHSLLPGVSGPITGGEESFSTEDERAVDSGACGALGVCSRAEGIAGDAGRGVAVTPQGLFSCPVIG